MRVMQPEGTCGSLKWLQQVVRHKPELITAQLPIEQNELVAWLSPVADDDYAEYRDESVLERLQVDGLKRPLASFWPKRGPQYDGLARTSSGRLFLIEAKAHVEELFSGTSAARNPDSIKLINKSLNAAKKFYQARPDANWRSPFYQYTNRLAHLYFLRELNGLDAHLVFVYFLNDIAEGKVCPRLVDGWKKATMVLHEAIGMTGRIPRHYVHDVYVDTREILGQRM